MPNYYTHFVFVSCIESPNIENTLIKFFNKNNIKDIKIMHKTT